MSNNKHRSRYSLPDPYPEVRVVSRNRFYAQLLLEDYTSEISEVTAINQYLYHHFRFKHWDLEDIAELEEGVAIIEMHHMEMLAELILKLGGDPRYRFFRNNKRQFYNAGFVYYGHSALDMLASDIDAEKAAIIQYRRHVEQINDQYIRAVLNRIIRDEEYHLRLFTDAYLRHQSKESGQPPR